MAIPDNDERVIFAWNSSLAPWSWVTFKLDTVDRLKIATECEIVGYLM